MSDQNAEGKKNISMKDLRLKLGKLQRKLKEQKIPTLIIFEGLDAAGKGTLINEVLLSLDPRGYNVFSNTTDTEEEKLRPFFWKFWNHLPEDGRMAVFDRSWYYSLIKSRKTLKSKEFEKRVNDINETESLFLKDGLLIIKFFLFIDKNIQNERLEKLDKNKATSWRVNKADWKNHKNYDKILKNYNELIEKTNSEICNWNIIDSKNLKDAKREVFQIINNKIEDYLEKNIEQKITKLDEINERINLDNIELDQAIEREVYEKKIKVYQKKLRKLEHELYIKRIPVVIAYEGWDAGGKGGNIKRLVQKMDPRGYDVIPIAAPNDIEKRHHYLWRFWTKFPKGGHIAVFDRTWYGRVMVERIEGFCSEIEWTRAYKEIKEMEKQWSDFGAVILKFWIHIDKDEQLRRFEERQKNEFKKWKITDEDWRNREKWDLYKNAVEEMIERTSTKHSPWHVIEGNSKLFARLKVIEIVIKAIEDKLK